MKCHFTGVATCDWLLLKTQICSHEQDKGEGNGKLFGKMKENDAA